MGTQGLLRANAMFVRPAGDQGGLVRLALLATSVAMVGFLGGCSSSSPFSAQANSSNPNQTASVPPPPNYAVTAAGQPAYAPPPGQPAYPPPPGQQAYAPRPGQQAYAPPPPGQPGYAPPPAQPGYAQEPAPPQAPPPEQAASAGSFRQSYAGFLQMFRDPPERDPSAPPAYDARASTYPQQSLTDTFKGSTDPNQRPDPTAAGYPQQPLVGNSRTSAAPAQQAYVPRPPNTYTPSQQPYVPPQGQPAYVPPPAQQNYAPPPAQPAYAPRPGQQSYAAPPAQPAYAAPATGATAAAAPPATQDYTDSLPYPKQSLVELFRGSSDTQTQTVPHPPATYTPSNQPYSPPPGQPAAYGAPPPGATAAAAPRPGATAAAAPPPTPDPTDSLPYPKQSLFEVFSGK